MTDTFLDDQQQADLARNLRTIATHSSELARIARRESSPPGGRAARNPNGYQSRPPMNLHALDVLNDHAVETCDEPLLDDDGDLVLNDYAVQEIPR